jgi:hypothetical protein
MEPEGLQVVLWNLRLSSYPGPARHQVASLCPLWCVSLWDSRFAAGIDLSTKLFWTGGRVLGTNVYDWQDGRPFDSTVTAVANPASAGANDGYVTVQAQLEAPGGSGWPGARGLGPRLPMSFSNPRHSSWPSWARVPVRANTVTGPPSSPWCKGTGSELEGFNLKLTRHGVLLPSHLQA